MRSERITVTNIRQKITCEADAYVYIEDLRWGGHPVCAHCGSDRVNLLNPENGVSRKTRTGAQSQRRVWKCYGCRKQFSVLTGTIFHGTKVSLEIWIYVLFEMCANKNGVAAREIERKYGVTAKTAWFMTQRIREAMKLEPLAGMLKGTIVADETFIGGKPKNMHAAKRKELTPYKPFSGRAYGDSKTAVLSLIDKQTGEVRSRVMPSIDGSSLRKAIAEHVDIPSSVLHTDSGNHYNQVGREFVAHESVNHTAGEYVRGNVTTNHAEGYFSQLKRSIDGTHHHVSPEHLSRYLAEFDYRYSTRNLDDSARTRRLMGQVGGKRLTYRPLRESRD